MKTKYIYIGSNIFLANKFKVVLSDFDVVVYRNPATALKYLGSNNNIKAIIFESIEDKATVLEFVRLFNENENQDILFLMLINTKQNISMHKQKPNELLKQCADEIIHLKVDINLSNREIIDVCNRIDMRIENKKNYALHLLPKRDHYNIPGWKRVFDILFSLMAILVLSPILLITAIAIRIESRGPVFYTSKRVGTGYRIFNFYKFRSMYVDADKRIELFQTQNQYSDENDTANNIFKTKEYKEGPILMDEERTVLESEYLYYKRTKQEASFFKLTNDPRITLVGRFIRNTSIDELLQLFNILKGDMSVVGNRPLPLYEAETLTSDEWIERFLAPAGLTGLWQVTKRAKSTKMSPDERKQLDIDYSRKYSFAGDLKIILKTVPALLQHENV